MRFTELFIRRPVLSLTVSLLIVVLGSRSLTSLPVTQYPRTQNSIITVTTQYFGADAKTIAGFIAQPLEAAIAQAQGIDYLSSNSSSGVSTITATLRLNYDANRALTEINTQVASVRNQLPPQAQQPVLTVQTGQTTDSMYIGFYSQQAPTNDITDYVLREVKPTLDSVDGVQTAEIIGGRQFALRAWLDKDKMAARGITAADVSTALAANNALAGLGTAKGQMVSIPLTANTDLHSSEEFRTLIVKRSGDALVRLGDIATVSLGSENYDVNVAFDGVTSVFVGIKVAPQANILDVAQRIRAQFPHIQEQLPGGLTAKIAYDATEFINTSIHEVIQTLIEALVIVTVVIFLFLASFRAVAIPVIAMPLSLIGTFALMLALGYTVNLLTLLALVLAIGLVVDDAIIVVENVDRHLKAGESPMQAAISAAGELSGPIVAMTVVLVAVYVPVGFQGGLTGALFTEFAFTLAAAVVVSGVIALTLSPMLCSRLLAAEAQSRLVVFVNRRFEALQHSYDALLSALLRSWPIVIGVAAVLIVLLGLTFKLAKYELAPEEDQGLVLGQVIGAPTATAAQMQTYAHQIFETAKSLPEYQQMFQITGVPNTSAGIGGVLFEPWDQRARGAHELQQVLQAKWNSIAGARVAAFQFPPLPGSSGLPVQFVINTTESFDRLNEVVQAVLKRAQDSGKFYFLDADLKVDAPQATVVPDRDRIAALGMTQQDLAGALSSALGGNYVNYFAIDGRSYRVIPQMLQVDRLNADQVLDYFVKTPSAGLITLRTIAHLTRTVEPEAITRFQQLNSATIAGVPAASQGEVLSFLANAVHEVAPVGFHIDYASASRQFVQESGGFAATMGFAIIIVFLVLAALFESFRDPIVILVSVPLALFGAMTFILWGFASMNIYTEVGLVTLVGLISKHGILIVEVANQMRSSGHDKTQAVRLAAGIRLRPILMTTAAMVFGVVPLVFASGAGAAGRHDMGLVIFAGLAIGTLFTLFVVPCMYVFLASERDASAREGAPATQTA